MTTPSGSCWASLTRCWKRRAAAGIGFVLMPNHVHAVLWFPKAGQLSRFMHEWKRRSSLNIRQWYRENADHYAAELGEGERIWQPKY